MKATASSLMGLTLFLGLANAQSGYDSACNPPPSGEQDVETGIVATYGCGDIHNAADYANEQISVATPRECAVKCAQRSPEGPCSWHGDICYFYNPGAGFAAWPNAVTVVVRKDWDKLKAVHDQTLEDLKLCKAAATSGPNISTKQCPGTGSIVTAGGKKWKVSCQTGHGAAAVVQTGTPFNTIEECILHCTSNSPCGKVHFNHNDGNCWLYQHGNPNPASAGFSQEWDIYEEIP